MSCGCEPGTRPILGPHAPWDCQINPTEWERDFDPDCCCGYQTLDPACRVHGWLVPLADGLVTHG